jgi:hypothetical protein
MSEALSYFRPIHVEGYSYFSKRLGRQIDVGSYTYLRWVVAIPADVVLEKPRRKRRKAPPKPRPKRRRRARPAEELPEELRPVRVERPKVYPPEPEGPPVPPEPEERPAPEKPPELVGGEGYPAFVPPGEEPEPFRWVRVSEFLESELTPFEQDDYVITRDVKVYHSESSKDREYVERRSRFLYPVKLRRIVASAFGKHPFFVLVRSWHLVIFPRKRPKQLAIFTRHDVLGIVRSDWKTGQSKKRKYQFMTSSFDKVLKVVGEQVEEVVNVVETMAEGYAEYKGLLCWTVYAKEEDRPSFIDPKAASERTKTSWRTRKRRYGKHGRKPTSSRRPRRGRRS